MVILTRASQQFKPPWSLYLTLAMLSLLALPLFFPSPGRAATNRMDEKQRIERGIEKFRLNISKLEDGITGQQQQIQSTKLAQRDLLDELKTIESRLASQLKKRRGLEAQMGQQEVLIAAKESALEKAQGAKQIVQNHLQIRIKSFYKLGTIGAANVAFSSSGLAQMLTFRDSFKSLIEYDKHILNTYHEAIADLRRAKATLDLEKEVLNSFITLARAEEEASQATKRDQESLLTQIATQQELHIEAVKEMEKAAANLNHELESLTAKDALFDQGFLLEKGSHPAPLRGKVLTFYGQEHKNRLGLASKTSGITIASDGRQRVTAIFEGKVRYASYLYGYGNTIIIDHGYKYFSITSRLEKLLVKKGDSVKEGATIALAGDTATLMEGGIYLEIRHGSTLLDPLQWLDQGSLIPQ